MTWQVLRVGGSERYGVTHFFLKVIEHSNLRAFFQKV
jgi:hypothetical protein